MTPIYRRAFTVIETLVAIGVVGIIFALLLSAVQAARGAAMRGACQNNVKQIALAAQLYHDAHGTFPAAFDRLEEVPGSFVNWPIRLLPYIEQEPLWDRTVAAFGVTINPTINPPHVGLSTVIKVYACPADGRLSVPITDDLGYTAAYGSYMGIDCGGCTPGRGFNGAMPSFQGVNLLAITDGASNTLLMGERPPWGRYLSGAWYAGVVPTLELHSNPNWAGGGIGAMDVVDSGNFLGCRGPIGYGPGQLTNRCDVLHFWSLHSGGANFAFCDGSVRFLSYSAAPIMVPLATRAGGEPVALPD
jgi:prepilin-type processing-associated H-X9-DG protein